MAVLAVPLATAQLGAQATSAVAGKAHIGSWGFDLTGLDTAVKPGDDFFRYMAGKWDDRTEIPADRPSVGSFNDLRETTGDQVKTLITTYWIAAYAFIQEARGQFSINGQSQCGSLARTAGAGKMPLFAGLQVPPQPRCRRRGGHS